MSAQPYTLSEEDHDAISERSFDNDRDVANYAYQLGIERGGQKAREAALEEAAVHFLRDGPYVERFSENIADDLRALKDQPLPTERKE